MHILASVFHLTLIGFATALPSSLVAKQVSPPIDGPSSTSCLSLRNSCNATTVDLSNFYNYTSCFLLTACLQGTETPAQVLSITQAPATQPRLTESVWIRPISHILSWSSGSQAFFAMSNGNSYMTQQNYIDAYYQEISVTPGGTYPDEYVFLQYNWFQILMILSVACLSLSPNGRPLLPGLVSATLKTFPMKISLCVLLVGYKYNFPYASSRIGSNILVPLEYVPQSCRAMLLWRRQLSHVFLSRRLTMVHVPKWFLSVNFG